MAKVLTPARRARLEKLAAYLESLPVDYRHFNMSTWIRAQSAEAEKKYALKNGGVASCGTVACAIGHGPAAGILVPRSMVETNEWGEPEVKWKEYCSRFIGPWEDFEDPGEPYFDWLFSDDWKWTDNHHHGAAARIRYVLCHGAPPQGFKCAAKRWLPEYVDHKVLRPASVDRSGEAGETALAGSTEGESAVPAQQGDAHPSTPES